MGDHSETGDDTHDDEKTAGDTGDTGDAAAHDERDQPAVPSTEGSGTTESSKHPAETDTGERLDALGARDGWRIEGAAARVHYRGETDRYSIEFYALSDCTLYWKVPPEDSPQKMATPVGRNTVPTPLRERVRADLAAAGIDPDIERQTL